MIQQWRALWVAVGYLSQAAALAVSAVVATWTLTILLLTWTSYGQRLWNDRRISILTLGLDLAIIMATSVNTRRANRQADLLEQAAIAQAQRDHAHATALAAIERRLARIETLAGLPAERHPNRRTR